MKDIPGTGDRLSTPHTLVDYTVTLVTAVVTETDTLTRSSYITVSAGGCVSPTAGFSGTPLTGTAPLTVTVTDASSGTISGWWWSFGDGGSSSETNPGHPYTETGVFTVSLTVSGACGSDVLTRTNYITVSSGYTATATTITCTYDSLSRLAEAEYSEYPQT